MCHSLTLSLAKNKKALRGFFVWRYEKAPSRMTGAFCFLFASLLPPCPDVTVAAGSAGDDDLVIFENVLLRCLVVRGDAANGDLDGFVVDVPGIGHRVLGQFVAKHLEGAMGELSEYPAKAGGLVVKNGDS